MSIGTTRGRETPTTSYNRSGHRNSNQQRIRFPNHRSDESSSVRHQFDVWMRRIRRVHRPTVVLPVATIVSFIVLFLVYGSFRPNVAQQHNKHKYSNQSINQKEMNVHNADHVWVEYRMIEEETDNASRLYRKYVAITSNINRMHDRMHDDHHDRIPTTVTILNDTTTNFITVSQWVQAVANTTPRNSISTTDKNKRGNMAITLLNEIIRTSPYGALFFETPAVTCHHQYETQRFEFVLVNAPELREMTIEQHNNHHDSHPFEKALSSSLVNDQNNNRFAVSFPNLGGDAILIVPKNIPTVDLVDVESHREKVTGGGSSSRMIVPSTARYAHLANFIRFHHSPLTSNDDMVDAVWQMVAQTYHEQVRSRLPSQISHHQSKQQGLWLSTSGLGVLYLHFRIDTVPKYYSHLPYKQIHS